MTAAPDTTASTKIAPTLPLLWRVVVHNDDYTPMAFVTALLMDLFGHSEEDATRLMLRVHRTGWATAGVYTKEIAHTRARDATRMAEAFGHPLRVSAERS